jgi:hypothetical protein
MEANGIDRRSLLGAGGILTTSSADAEAPLPKFTPTAAGTPSPQRVGDWLADSRNVKDFGAVGNGIANDTAAIQAAVDWAGRANRGAIYFPPGTYRITSSIRFNRPKLNIAFRGDPGATIVGDFSGFLLKRGVDNPTRAICVIENLRFINRHVTGRGIALQSCASGKIVNCHIVAWRGIEIHDSQSVLVDTCIISAPADSSTSAGIIAAAGATIISTHVTGYHHGIRHSGVGLTVYGGRMVDNWAAIVLGVDEQGEDFRSRGFNISGVSMKANHIGVHVVRGVGGIIRATSIGGGNRMAYGLRLDSCQDVVVQGVVVDGLRGYVHAGIAIESPRRTALIGVSSLAPKAWMLPRNRSELTFIQTNKR